MPAPASPPRKRPQAAKPPGGPRGGLCARLALACLLAFSAAPPGWAVPPGPGTLAEVVAEDLPEQAHAPADPGGPGRGRLARTLGRLGTLLRRGLVAALLLADAQALPGAAQPAPLFLSANPLPPFNLSAPDPTSAFVAQRVGLALAHANGTGALPPLADLNQLLAGANPLGGSVLQTLPAQGPWTTAQASSSAPPAATGAVPSRTRSAAIGTSPEPTENTPQLPSFLLNSPANQPVRTPTPDPVTAARTNLDVAQLTNAFYILEAIGNQLLGDAALLTLTGVPQVAAAVEFTGFQLASVGFGFAFAASMETTQAAQQALDAALEAQTAQPPPQPQEVQAAFDPDVLYGTWRRFENASSGMVITYRFSRSEFLKSNTTTGPDGSESTDLELHPGAVTGYVSYRRPAPGAAPGDGDERILVRLVVANENVQPLELKFFYLRAKGRNAQDDADVFLDILVERDGEHKAFVKTS